MLLTALNAPDSRTLLTVFFIQAGAEAIAASCVFEALILLERHLPHLLISDLRLPEADGYNLIHQV